MFRVGQKVVCVDGDFHSVNQGRRIPANLPVEQAVYTIRDLVHMRGKDFMRLVEVANPEWPFVDDGGPFEPAFAITRFRPIVERTTDISVFEEILRRESAPSSLTAEA